MKSKWNNLIQRIGIAGAILALALSACSSAAAPTQQFSRNDAQVPALAPMMEKSAGGAAPAAPRPAEGQTTVASDTANQAIERIVIKNASITISVADPSKSMTTISKMAEEMGGFVVSANMYKETLSSGAEVPRASITIRVPADQLNTALDQIRAQSKQEPISESANSQDVTNEYIDLQSRQKNLEAAEADLTKIMDQAYKTEDVLSVYNQLVSIREQIEVIKGQIKYYSESAHFSAISIELVADAAVQPIEIGGWQPQGVMKEAVKALIRTMQFLLNALIWIVIYILPVLLVLFVIFILPPLLLIRAWSRRRAKRKAAVAAELASQQKPPETGA
jgi:Domain of unknown function (DUF4349)